MLLFTGSAFLALGVSSATLIGRECPILLALLIPVALIEFITVGLLMVNKIVHEAERAIRDEKARSKSGER